MQGIQLVTAQFKQNGPNGRAGERCQSWQRLSAAEGQLMGRKGSAQGSGYASLLAGDDEDSQNQNVVHFQNKFERYQTT